jgi:hypothetical protein
VFGRTFVIADQDGNLIRACMFDKRAGIIPSP